jgi:hypothetical protein
MSDDEEDRGGHRESETVYLAEGVEDEVEDEASTLEHSTTV